MKKPDGFEKASAQVGLQKHVAVAWGDGGTAADLES
jgi:hypothetical protein